METFVKSYWSSRFGSQPSIPDLRRVVNVGQNTGLTGNLPLGPVSFASACS